MCAEPLHIHDACLVRDRRGESVLVPFDVEDRIPPTREAHRGKPTLHILGRSPNSVQRLVMPSLKGAAGVGMPLEGFSQSLRVDNPHDASLASDTHVVNMNVPLEGLHNTFPHGDCIF